MLIANIKKFNEINQICKKFNSESVYYYADNMFYGENKAGGISIVRAELPFDPNGRYKIVGKDFYDLLKNKGQYEIITTTYGFVIYPVMLGEEYGCKFITTSGTDIMDRLYPVMHQDFNILKDITIEIHNSFENKVLRHKIIHDGLEVIIGKAIMPDYAKSDKTITFHATIPFETEYGKYYYMYLQQTKAKYEVRNYYKCIFTEV